MIAFIQGTVVSYTTDSVVLNHEGMGWEIAYPHTDHLHINESYVIYTYLHIFEGGMNLYGFETQAEKELFLRLISVKGLGPKTAMNMLSKSGYDAIVRSIENGDVSALKKMPGIGAKSASQIVLDLKGKLVPSDTTTAQKQSDSRYSKELSEAIEGLKNLGFRQSELQNCVNTLYETPGLTTEEYLKMGLQFMAKAK